MLETVTGLFCETAATFAASKGGRTTKALYQWLSERASFFRSDSSGRATTRTVRTEVTVQREGLTLLVGGAAAGLDHCPLCGQKLAPAQAEQARLRLQEGPISQEDLPSDLPTDGTSP